MKLWKDFVQHIIVVIGILVGLSTGVPTNTDIQQDGSYEFFISRTNGMTGSVTIQSYGKLDIESASEVLVTIFRREKGPDDSLQNIPELYRVTTRSFDSQDVKKQKILQRYMWGEYQVLEDLQKLFCSPDTSSTMEEEVTKVFKVFLHGNGGDSPIQLLTSIAEFWGERFDHWEKTHGQKLREQQPPPEIARLILQMAKGVGALHHKNIAHRNLRLESFVINEQRQIKIMDFGYSIRLKGKDVPYLNKAKFEGDRAYAAPETQPPNDALINDPRELYARDMWSMGVLMVRLFSGQFPPGYKYFADSSASTRISKFIGWASTPFKGGYMDNYYKTSQEDYNVPKKLVSIIHKCLKQRWKERANIDEVITAFEKYIALPNLTQERSNEEKFCKIAYLNKIFGKFCRKAYFKKIFGKFQKWAPKWNYFHKWAH